MCSPELVSKEQETYLKEVRKLKREVKKDPAKGMALLVKAGIYTKGGNPKKQFK